MQAVSQVDPITVTLEEHIPNFGSDGAMLARTRVAEEHVHHIAIVMSVGAVQVESAERRHEAESAINDLTPNDVPQAKESSCPS